MSGDELGRPKYAARPAAVSSAVPPDFGTSASTGRRRGAAASGTRSEGPVDERRQAKAAKRDGQPVSGGTVYVPVPRGAGVGYGLWRFLRFIVLMLAWLVLTMFKVALSPFVHIMGGTTRPRW